MRLDKYRVRNVRRNGFRNTNTGMSSKIMNASQFLNRNRIWIKSMDKKITDDIIDVARDLEHEERNGRNCM